MRLARNWPRSPDDRWRVTRQATSRAHYAALYAARVALETAGQEPPMTHSGMRGRFSDLAQDPEPRSRARPGAQPDRCRPHRGRPRSADITVEAANEAMAKAEHIVEVIERALERGLSDEAGE
jgi:uncharacterized protein (UPF0332 family)